MRYHALATDYDGTVATHGVLEDETVAALGRLRASGRKLLLVTGRRIEDLQTVCPDLTLFDSIVGENGALVYRPGSREVRLLAPPPPPGFVRALRERGVDAIDVGHVIVATWSPHESAVLDVIRQLGLELQVIFNKGAVMVLPSGVNKATGLDAALEELGLSPHNVVAVGDAENDHAFLSRCEAGVAVANALDSLKQRADWVTERNHGAGVSELIAALLADDLGRIAPKLARHDIPLGEDADGPPGAMVRVPAYGTSMLIAGTSGGGKSAMVTGLLERMTERGYQQCILDPEGDYAGYEGAVVLAGAKRAPTVDEVAAALASPARNVVVSLLGVPLAERPAFATALLRRLVELRARFGRPHWIVLDEAQHLLPAGWQASDASMLENLGGLVLITVNPRQVSPVALAAVNLMLATGGEPQDTLDQLAVARGCPAPRIAPETTLDRGDALVWRPGGSQGQGHAVVRVRTMPARTERVRHARKYAETDLGPDKSFYFHGPDGKLNLRAQNLHLFLQVADGVDDATWLHHLRAGEYSAWIRDAIKDDALAEEMAAVEAEAAHRPTGAGDDKLAAATRARVRAAIEARYTGPA